MSPRTLTLLRDLHLYAGLFLSPFAAVFAISVFPLVHAWNHGAVPTTETRPVPAGILPPDLEKLPVREQVAAARKLLDQLGVAGEINHLRYHPREHRLVLPVEVPGRETTVEVRLAAETATVTTHHTGTSDALVYLHRMPGPHNVALRGNSGFMRVWRVLTDATVCLVLLVTASGVAGWHGMKRDRRAGWTLAFAGTGTVALLVFALTV